MNTDRWKIGTPPGIGNEEERSKKEVAHGKQLTGERDEERNEDKLETRVMRLEEQTKWMYDRMTAAAEPSTWNRGISWKYEDEGDEWQRWEGSWWIRVNQDDLNSRQRRKISRGLKKMIDCEKNGMARLSQELKKGIRDQDGVLTRTLKTMRDLETKMKTAPRITDAFHLCSDVPALCSRMYFIRYPQHTMLSVMSKTVFNFRALCCPLGVFFAKSGEFEKHDSLRLKQLPVYPRATRDNSIVTLERWAAQCAYYITMYVFATTAGDVHVGKNDLNDVYVVTQRQILIDQIVQETTEIPQLQYMDNIDNISVAGIMQVSRVRIVTKTGEIPQSQYIDELINDFGVRASQVLIVEKTVENSQLR